MHCDRLWCTGCFGSHYGHVYYRSSWWPDFGARAGRAPLQPTAPCCFVIHTLRCVRFSRQLCVITHTYRSHGQRYRATGVSCRWRDARLRKLTPARCRRMSSLVEASALVATGAASTACQAESCKCIAPRSLNLPPFHCRHVRGLGRVHLILCDARYARAQCHHRRCCCFNPGHNACSSTLNRSQGPMSRSPSSSTSIRRRPLFRRRWLSSAPPPLSQLLERRGQGV